MHSTNNKNKPAENEDNLEYDDGFTLARLADFEDMEEETHSLARLPFKIINEKKRRIIYYKKLYRVYSQFYPSCSEDQFRLIINNNKLIEGVHFPSLEFWLSSPDIVYSKGLDIFSFKPFGSTFKRQNNNTKNDFFFSKNFAKTYVNMNKTSSEGVSIKTEELLKIQDADIKKKISDGTFDPKIYPYAYIPIQKQVYPTSKGYEIFIWCKFLGYPDSHNMMIPVSQISHPHDLIRLGILGNDIFTDRRKTRMQSALMKSINSPISNSNIEACVEETPVKINSIEESSKLTSFFSISIDKLCFEREKEKQEDLEKKRRKNLKNRRKRVKRNTKYKEKKKQIRILKSLQKRKNNELIYKS